MNPSEIDHQLGLTDEQVLQSRKERGANTLTPPAREPLWKLFLEKFDDSTIKILLAAAVLSVSLTAFEKFVLHNEASFIDSIGIFLAVGLATLAGFLSELKSSREFELLNKVKDDINVKVLRRSAQTGAAVPASLTEISINDVVVGDIVQLSLGDKVPADGTVIEAQGLLVDEAVMTGESVPAEKTVSGGTCTVFRGTMVADGHGRFIVTAVGDDTKLGQIAANLNENEDDTPLVQKLTKLAKQISIVGMSGAVLIFAVMSAITFWDWFRMSSGGEAGTITLLHGLLQAFIVAVTIIVVAVPEGLPMMVTVSLALNMMKMARENCLIRKLVASETIGSATVVCTDKTGTLTENKMTVVWQFPVSEGGLSPQFIEAISINSTADVGEKSIGNPTECALLMFLKENGVDYRQYRDKYPRLRELSHNSERKMSLVEVDISEPGAAAPCLTVYSKGAPEKILSQCGSVFVNGEVCSMDNYRTKIDEALKSATEQALRVLAVAVDDTLLALIGISDPIRSGVPHAVEVCHSAGVDVKMITGDAEPTAIAIAKQAGIITTENGELNAASDGLAGLACTSFASQNSQLVLTSDELEKWSEEELVKNIPRLKVLARATPMDKLRLVKAMHKLGEVVAMTGDGTNDAPALKFADVGVSMGITGTEVAKEASDIVLIDDNFKSIVTGIWWGRTLYENIQKFLVFQLTVNFVAMTCCLIGPFIGVPLPLTVPQLLWLNIIMDTLAALALSSDPPRESFMKRKPVPREASIITPAMFWTIGLTGAFQIIILLALLFADCSSTIFFTVFVAFQFWNIFASRTLHYGESMFTGLLKNRLFLMIVTLIAAVQVGMVQASPYLGIGAVFRTEALSAAQWGGIALLTVSIIPFSIVVRWVLRKL